MKIKNALIFAAGFGKRLAPITDSLPKPLVKVAGKSLIQYHIEKLVKLGVEQIVINTHWLHEKLVDELGDGRALGACIQWSHEPVILETGGGMQNALPLLGQEPFIVVSADIWTDYSFIPLLDSALLEREGDSFAHLVMVENPEHNLKGDFLLSGQLATNEENSRFFTSVELCSGEDGKESDRQKASYTYSGIGLFCSEFISHYLQSKSDRDSPFGSANVDSYPLREPLAYAIAQGKVSAELYKGQWHDIGTIDRLNALEQRLNQKSGSLSG